MVVSGATFVMTGDHPVTARSEDRLPPSDCHALLKTAFKITISK